MKIDIPVQCPKCLGRMYSVFYDCTLNILKRRTWHICKQCGYERDVEQFKRELLTV